ncbi:QueT transporter family protein [[Clostridium] aminophilum]|uniref:QueT transporter family protein n=1 Tax=[Clostridium] aminophilum TaxID=1526 RepID=UPI00332D7220
MRNKNVLRITQAALIAALYVTLTYVFAAISFGEVQLRIAEALTILPMFTPAAIPGLFVGCILGNMLGGAVLPDIICGSLATLAGAYGTWMLRNRQPFFGCIPPIAANMLVVPFVLRYAYGVELPIPFMALTVGAGEVLGCGILGCILYYALVRHKKAIFRSENANVPDPQM